MIDSQSFIRAAEQLSPASLESLTDFYALDATFTDPFQTVVGRPAIRRVYAAMFDQLDAPRFTNVRVLASPGNGQLMLRWTFEFALKRQGPRQSIDGTSLLEIGPEGLIVRHTDFWDASLLMQGLPLIGPLIGWVRRKIAHA
jgi:steroid Delta-isomerase